MAAPTTVDSVTTTTVDSTTTTDTTKH
jgi:hypothetical protein